MVGGKWGGAPSLYPRRTSSRHSGEDLRKGKLTDLTYSKECEMKKGLPPSRGPRRPEDQPMESLGKELGSVGTGGFAKT